MFSERFLVVERIRCRERGVSKKRALQTIGELLWCHEQGLTANQVFDHLVQREQLGSTGLGEGIGLPHARIAGIPEARGALLLLERGIDYDAPDSQPVDLLFGLLVPEGNNREHLELLAKLAEMFGDEGFRTLLRGAGNAAQALEIFRRQSEVIGP